jgi:hypothetical protein
MEYKIYWSGVVCGSCTVEAESLEEAMQLAEDGDEPIETEDYPEWEIDEPMTKAFNEEPK